MLRVPGTDGDLFQVKGRGGDVRVVYSPLDAVELAVKNPEKQVVFFGVGFETTAPANAMSVHLAKRRGLKNFSLLVSHVLVPPAIEAIMSSPDNQVQAFLAAGHVCSVMGYWEYPPLAEKFGIPIVVTGFEPLDLLDGIRRAVIQLERGEHRVENAYERIVTYAGNLEAQQLLAEVFEVTDRAWRGIGVIPRSGWRLNSSLSANSTRRGGSRFRASARWSRRCARRAMCCAGRSSRERARRLAKSARRGIRWERPWFQARAPARRTSITGGF